MTYTAHNVPNHVPQSKAEQWANVWNSVYSNTIDDGDKSRDECEARAYHAANSILSNRSNTMRPGDTVMWVNENGMRQRGVVKEVRQGEDDGDVLYVVEKYRPIRDGWEASGKMSELRADECTKTDPLYEPQKPSHKTDADEPVEPMKAARSMGTEIKRLSDNVIGGYALVYGSDAERDVEGDYFTKSTDLWLDVYNRQPILFDHASGVEFPDDPDIPEDDQDMPRRYKIGSIIKTVKDEKGLWIEAVLDAHNKWVDGIWKLVDRGALHFSSGSVPHMIKRADDGAVKSWPIIEVSLTPTPAEPRNTKVLNLAGDTTIADQGGAIRRSDLGRRESIAKFSIQLMEDSRGVIKMNNLNRRLRSLLDVYWGAELAAAASSYKAARRAAKQEGVTPEESEIVEEAASKLDELVQPIADQAKSALGVDADEVKAMLYKMALSKCSKQDIPVEDEEVIDEELLEEFPTLDTGMDGEDFEAGPELMDEEPLDQFTDAEDFTDEEEEIMASRRHANIDAVIERELRRLSPRGSYSTKRFNMITTRNTEPSLSRQIKAIRDKDMSILRGTAQRTASHYKALGINPDTAGGFLIVPEQADEVIEILRAKSVFLRVEGDAKTGGAESLVTVLPMNTDTMFIPRQTGGATAYWVGENAQITASDQTFGQIQLVAKKVAAMVKISNELLNDSSTDVDAFIRADISRQLANAVDVAVLRGAGVAGQPMGIKVTPGVSATALNAVPTYTNLTNLVSTVETANVEQDDSWAWIINPRDKSVFRRITDTAGQYIFAGNALQAAELGVPEMLLGYKWIATSNVYNSGGGTPETDIYFGRWRDVVIGMRKTIEIVASDVAGNSFEYDQTYIRAIMRLDIALRHTESIALLTDVRAS